MHLFHGHVQISETQQMNIYEHLVQHPLYGKHLTNDNDCYHHSSEYVLVLQFYYPTNWDKDTYLAEFYEAQMRHYVRLCPCVFLYLADTQPVSFLPLFCFKLCLVWRPVSTPRPQPSVFIACREHLLEDLVNL